MKHRSKKTFRAAVAVISVLLSGCFLLAGMPVLATEQDGQAGTLNESPIAENLSYSTFRNIPVRGFFSAMDPDDDAVTFEIAIMPGKGSVRAEQDGSFVYQPDKNSKGRDTFTYVAIDTAGNISDQAVVTVDIMKQSTKIAYSDMSGNGSYYAALVLAEKNILIGEKLGGEYFFRPDAPVTRGEFLAMCMAANDQKTIRGVTRTGFYDDANIPLWVKPYVTTALMNGFITGYKNHDGQLVFAPLEPISVSEAAVLLDNILNITDVTSVSALSQDVCPAWAYQAAMNLTACKILAPTVTLDSAKTLTRADAAEMLVAALQVTEARPSGNSLLSWLS